MKDLLDAKDKRIYVTLLTLQKQLYAQMYMLYNILSLHLFFLILFNYYLFISQLYILKIVCYFNGGTGNNFQ